MRTATTDYTHVLRTHNLGTQFLRLRLRLETVHAHFLSMRSF